VVVAVSGLAFGSVDGGTERGPTPEILETLLEFEEVLPDARESSLLAFFFFFFLRPINRMRYFLAFLRLVSLPASEAEYESAKL
jgi:hypothetical protein